MALIEWSENYSVGVASLDEQHKRLVELINRLHQAMLDGQGRSVVHEILDALIDYTKVHFSTEEKLMESHGYPDLEAQRAQHTDLVRQVAEFQEKEKSGRLTLSMELISFLRDGWLVKHIVASDKRYGPFFREKGVS